MISFKTKTLLCICLTANFCLIPDGHPYDSNGCFNGMMIPKYWTNGKLFITTFRKYILTWNPKHPFINGWFNWMMNQIFT